MTQADAEEIACWHYPEPFAFYDWSADADDLAELLEPRRCEETSTSPSDDENGELAGFFSFKQTRVRTRSRSASASIPS